MPYVVQLGDVLEARVVCFDATAPNQIGINRLRFEVQAIGGTSVNQTQCASAIDTAIAANYKLWLANTATYRGVSVQKIFPLPKVVAEYSITNAGAGTGGANAAPTQASGLIKLLTPLAGRPFRGRLYIPFIPSASLTAAGNLTGGALANLTNIANSLVQSFIVVSGGNQATLSPCLWHNKGYGGRPGPPVIPPIGVNTFTLITLSAASPLIATQRRRGNYGRENPTTPF